MILASKKFFRALLVQSVPDLWFTLDSKVAPIRVGHKKNHEKEIVACRWYIVSNFFGRCEGSENAQNCDFSILALEATLWPCAKWGRQAEGWYGLGSIQWCHRKPPYHLHPSTRLHNQIMPTLSFTCRKLSTYFLAKYMINWPEINFHWLPVITTECWQLLSQTLWNENLSLGRLFLNSDFLKWIINVVIL